MLLVVMAHLGGSLPLVSREWKNGSNEFLHSLLTKGKVGAVWVRSWCWLWLFSSLWSVMLLMAHDAVLLVLVVVVALMIKIVVSMSMVVMAVEL